MYSVGQTYNGKTLARLPLPWVGLPGTKTIAANYPQSWELHEAKTYVDELNAKGPRYWNGVRCADFAVFYVRGMSRRIIYPKQEQKP